jgi:acyl-CoA synthetase (AMP-forming)/AMP-acid ligase II
MILGDPQASHLETAERTTLDDLFRIAGVRRPDAMALCDPPNRRDFTDGEPLRLTYVQADHIVSAIAGRLRRLGLATDTVVALQLPNTVESTLTLLGVLRAGLIAAPLPMLWRKAEIVAALHRIGAKCIITTSRIGMTSHCELAANVAADVFAIRYVFSFGENLPDGVIPFDDLLTATPLLDAAEPVGRKDNPAAHVALVTLDVSPAGLVAVARSHSEVIAGGQVVLREAGLRENSRILACCANGSFAGLTASTMPWLLTGGTLSLHQPFDPAIFVEQCRHDGCDTVAVPGALTAHMVQAGLLSHSGLRHVLALWRAPERLPVSPSWPHLHVGMTDVLAFGETAVICGSRGESGEAAEIPLGPAFISHEGADALPVAETTVTQAGTLAIRGPMVPRYPFPPGTEDAPIARFKPDALGFADTGYACRADRDSGQLTISGPPPGIINVGGYRFMPEQLQHLVKQVTADAVLAALPDALAGHRLAGDAPDRTAVRDALDAQGVNPLVSGAFADRRRAGAI